MIRPLVLWVTLMAIGLTAASTGHSAAARHECSRPCGRDDAAGPRTCVYRFFVGKAAAEEHPARLINGTSPGPPIEICLGDRIEVTVENGLSSEEVSFHWHGLRQRASAHMDGVPMITQCPIAPYTSFRYDMKPETSGTHFYHAHSVQQQGDGLYGSLIVRGPCDDPSAERILVVSARTSGPLAELAAAHRTPRPTALILNGKTENVRIGIDNGAGRVLLRIINANAFNCPVSFFVAEHDLEIIAVDGNEVESGRRTQRIIVYPGERFDVAIAERSSAADRYVVTLRGFQDCQGLRHEASLDYGLTTNDEMIAVRAEPSDDEPLNSLDLRIANRRTSLESSSPIKTVLVPFDVYSYDRIEDVMTDYSFNMYDPPYYPSYLSTNAADHAKLIAQINRVSFLYPSSPLLSQPVSHEPSFCSIERNADELCNNRQRAEEMPFCECTQILRVPAFATVDVALIDQGFGDNVSHTFHVHGYDVAIVELGRFERPTKAEEAQSIARWNERRVADDEAGAVRKDTFVVPNKGYLVVRIRTDNVGYWLWEARSTGLYGGNDGQPPMQFVMLVGDRENMPTVPIDFPTCGDHKSPASIFHDAE